MARTLARTLLRRSTPPAPIPRPPSVLPFYLSRRHLSSKPQLIEIDLSPSSSSSSPDGGDEDSLVLQRLEEMVHRLTLQKSTPDWLPFVPGSSFWVPPRKRPSTVAQLVHKLSDTLTPEESLSLTSSRGFPSSQFFTAQHHHHHHHHHHQQQQQQQQHGKSGNINAVVNVVDVIVEEENMNEEAEAQALVGSDSEIEEG